MNQSSPASKFTFDTEFRAERDVVSEAAKARLEAASFRDAHTRCLAQVPEYATLNDLLKAGTDP